MSTVDLLSAVDSGAQGPVQSTLQLQKAKPSLDTSEFCNSLEQGWLILAHGFLFRPSKTQPLHFPDAISSFLREATAATDANAPLLALALHDASGEAAACAVSKRQ